MNEKFARLLTVLSSPQFLQMRGNNNEAPIFIQPYPAEAENEVATHVRALASQLRKRGHAVVTIDLFALTISILSKEPGRLEKFLATEANLSKSKLRGVLSRIADAKSSVIPAIEQQLTDEPHNLIFLSGFGAVFPFLATKPILEGIQRVMTRKPLVVFYPGEYVQAEGLGSSLRLFGTFPALYYRAFNLDTYHVLSTP